MIPALARSTFILPSTRCLLSRVHTPLRSIPTARASSSTHASNMKVLMVLYSGGDIAKEQPRLLGTTENSLGMADWLKEKGHELVVTDSKQGADNAFEKHIKDADIFITTPFHPGYLSKDILATAKNLKICITAGVGSDHVDLDAANEKKIGVYEVTGSNVVSVAEHVIMSILILVRNYNVGHEQIISGGWNVAAVARDSYDLENKVIGTLGAGRIGFRVLQRLLPFQPKELLYYDYTPLPDEAAQEVKARRVEDLDEFLGQLDVLTINAPLHDGTRGLINKEKIAKMKDGAWIVNTARGAICNAEDVAEAVKSGKLLGYAGDVWDVQPAPEDHPWRKMINPTGGGNGMTPHVSGTSLDAQTRYSEGVKEILNRWFNEEPQKPADIIVENGEYASKAYGQREGNKK